jgi:hypothetical protein
MPAMSAEIFGGQTHFQRVFEMAEEIPAGDVIHLKREQSGTEDQFQVAGLVQVLVQSP